MKVQGSRFGIPLFAAFGLLLITSCSSFGAGDGEERTARLPHRICGTDISSAPIARMYPGPYTEASMHVPSEGRIDRISTSKGKTEGGCSIAIGQTKPDVYSDLTVNARTYPTRSMKNVLAGFEHQFTSNDATLSLGPARGHVAHEYAQLIQECKQSEGGSAGRPFAVISELFFQDRSSYKISEEDLNKGAAAQVANVARYLRSSVLKCSGPELPDGTPEITKSD
ncbi:hypothetical protein HCC61_15875 [Streptomyces sp. HNM0575]|uniref:hypothetical protein n=1 Tax=Streptomyces sp. HNM0575 TaxID=2716338 RepID=UPI00145C7B70|nr:hypothetical protein [Streptomyces sp. HNM0575]NLU74142.1 hypothetical protein [Streptomyces sp. HNM0575]